MVGTDFSENDGVVKKSFNIILDDLTERMTSVIPIPRWVPTASNVKANKATIFGSFMSSKSRECRF